MYSLRSSGSSRVHLYIRNSLTFYGNYLTDSIVLDLYAGYLIEIHPYNLDYDNTTVVCDPRVFSAEDLANLSYYSETQ